MISVKSLIVFIVTTGILSHTGEGLKTYSVKRITRALTLSGKGDDLQWKTAHVLSDFHYPWEKEKTPPTTFKALHDGAWVYCLFDVKDSSVYIHVDTNDKSEVAASSRAEIFFKADDKLNPYYCLEIDPLGRVLDYEGTYHRQFNGKWSWPKDQLIVKTNQRNDGYTVEFAVSKASLQKLGLLKDGTLQAGIFRADCVRTSGETEFKWISWGHPDSPTPDFHIPSSFGLLRLE